MAQPLFNKQGKDKDMNMNAVEQAYASGMAEALHSAGISEKSANDAASAITELEKKAAMFNFGDGEDSREGFNWSSVVIPLIAAGLAGYVGYNSRDQGSGDRSAFENVKNYVAGTGDKLFRRSRPRPFYDINRYLD